MNPAIEYFIRSGAAKDCLQVPCAIYLNHILYSKKQLIVTIDWHKFSNSYLVRHWHLDNLSSDNILPKFTEYSLKSKNDLFMHETTIVPMYELLAFKASPYQSGVIQRTTGQRAIEQNIQYQKTMDEFLNPHCHRLMRIEWLWMTFTNLHSKELRDTLNFPYLHEQMYMVMLECKPIWKKWASWCKYLACKTTTAVELVFYEPYCKKTKQEAKKIHMNSTWPPSRHLELILESIKERPTNSNLWTNSSMGF